MKNDLALAYAMRRRAKLGPVKSNQAEVEIDDALLADDAPLADDTEQPELDSVQAPSRVASIVSKYRKGVRSSPEMSDED